MTSHIIGVAIPDLRIAAVGHAAPARTKDIGAIQKFFSINATLKFQFAHITSGKFSTASPDYAAVNITFWEALAILECAVVAYFSATFLLRTINPCALCNTRTDVPM
jgi:hypothetical protein